ncbi:MAG: hypothetical protein ABSH06_05095 [Thermodesulfobacteriota bacterium]|jgi:hypothetical protein
MELPKCDVCTREVKIEEAVLSISFREIREVQEKREEFKKNHPSPFLDVREVMAFPGRVPWVWHHYGCNVNGSSYEIEADRFDSVTKALRWTLHLMQKNWFEFTDWRNVIERFYPECYWGEA